MAREYEAILSNLVFLGIGAFLTYIVTMLSQKYAEKLKKRLMEGKLVAKVLSRFLYQKGLPELDKPELASLHTSEAKDALRGLLRLCLLSVLNVMV